MSESDKEGLLWFIGGAALCALFLRGRGWGPPGKAVGSGTSSPTTPSGPTKGTVTNPYLLRMRALSCSWENGLPRTCVDVVQLEDGQTFALSWNPPRPPFAGAVVEVDVTEATSGGADLMEDALLERGWNVRLVSE